MNDLFGVGGSQLFEPPDLPTQPLLAVRRVATGADLVVEGVPQIRMALGERVAGHLRLRRERDDGQRHSWRRGCAADSLRASTHERHGRRRKPLRAAAKRHDMLPIAVILTTPGGVCTEGDRVRRDGAVPAR
ncbi:hypothetical protein ACIOYT_32940 [Streptomyces halstedii]|uniref:hypothetical protein n=1 Tax=Streptomyces halstedii TaxID=1944 RepID=UPI0037FA715B